MCYWCTSERKERRASFLGAARRRLKLARAESRPAFREALLGAALTFRNHAHAIANETHDSHTCEAAS